MLNTVFAKTPPVCSVFHETIHDLTLTSPTPRLDAEVLVMHVCGITRSELIVHNETVLTGEQEHKLANLLARPQRGDPVAYIIGTREFWSMELAVTPPALIPRPET